MAIIMLPRDNFDRDQKIRGRERSKSLGDVHSSLPASEPVSRLNAAFKNIRVQREIKVWLNTEIGN